MITRRLFNGFVSAVLIGKSAQKNYGEISVSNRRAEYKFIFEGRIFSGSFEGESSAKAFEEAADYVSKILKDINATPYGHTLINPLSVFSVNGSFTIKFKLKNRRLKNGKSI